MAYTLTVGLEIHAELKTATKMFCNSKNDPDETHPNTNICPVCMAHPGTLPVINKEAVRHVLKVGSAVEGKLADYTEFDRKNYFYPDLPKGYQISQYEYPLVSGGVLSGVELTRIHLEEDTARSLHDPASGLTKVDYNRAGVPLMELVTEPVIKSAEEAGSFARELRVLLRYLGVSTADMEKGEMRVEANISVGTGGSLGTKVEVKNLNSIRAMERAIEYEFKRQTKVLEDGGQVVQETRGWDEGKQQTFSQRTKEGAADYRYLPDPDLPSLKISELPDCTMETLRKELPELPWERRARYVALGLKPDDADFYVREGAFGVFFDTVSAILEKEGKDTYISTASNYISTDLVKGMRDIEDRESEIKDISSISAESFAKLMIMLGEGVVSSRGGKDILAVLIEKGGDPEKLAKELGLMQASSAEDILPIVEEVLSQNKEVVEEYKSGKEASLQYLIGQGMKLSKGSANPTVLRELMIEKIRG